MRRWRSRIGLVMLAAMVLAGGVAGCHSHRHKHRHYRDDGCYDRRSRIHCVAPDYRGGPYAENYVGPGDTTDLTWQAREWISAQRAGRGTNWAR
jgi:hypothetical protein